MKTGQKRPGTGGGQGLCKTCNSPHRVLIEEAFINNKVSYADAAQWIKDNFDESISGASVWRHMKKHVNLKGKVKEEYKNSRIQNILDEARAEDDKEGTPLEALTRLKSEELMRKYIGEGIEEIKKLDTLIKLDYESYLDASKLANEQVEAKMVSKNVVDLLRTLSFNMIASIRTKKELMGEDAESRKASAVETWVDLVAKINDY